MLTLKQNTWNKLTKTFIDSVAFLSWLPLLAQLLGVASASMGN
jgi:hypothetical protein